MRIAPTRPFVARNADTFLQWGGRMANATVAELDREFGIAGVAQILEGNGGLTAIRINTPAARGEMYLHGGHVTSWKPGEAEDVLFLSSHSLWQDSRAIRGGV